MIKLIAVYAALALGTVTFATSAAEVFFATATPSQEGHTPVQTTRPSCLATFRLSTPTTLFYRINCYNINRISMAHIHVGSADVNGPVRIGLYNAAASTTPTNGLLISGTIVRGSAAASEAIFDQTLADMRNDNTYFNLHTSDSPAGEVRGQIVAIDLVSESIFLY